MKTAAVNFTSGYAKGKAEFNKLSDTQKAVRMGIETFRQNHNAGGGQPYFPSGQSDLSQYVRFRVMLKNAINTVLNKHKPKEI